jgi:ATPases of the AAA+ class
MTHSKSSADFLEKLDEISAAMTAALEEMLKRDKIEVDRVGQALAYDLMALQRYITVSRKRPTHKQAAFFADLYDRARTGKSCGQAVQAHLDNLDQLVARLTEEARQLAPTTVIDKLKGFDVREGTDLAKQWKQFLCDATSYAFTVLHKPVAADKKLLERLEEELNEAITWQKKEPMHPDSPPLVAEAQSTIKAILPPLYQLCDASPSIAQMVNEPCTWVRQYLGNMCGGFVMVDLEAHEHEIALLCDLGPVFGLYGYMSSPKYVGKILTEPFSGEPLNPDERDTLVEILKLYDERRGTYYAQTAKSFLFRLANAVFKSDSTVADCEREWLEKFRKNLFPAGDEPEALLSPETIAVVDSQVDTAALGRTVEESLTELDSLIGLKRLKSEVSDLISELKERAETQSVPRRLVFFGRPGLGKANVARLLGDIYRDLGLLSQGHVVTMDFSSLVTGSIGGTIAKLNEKIEKAAGGVLFINQAQDFGSDAITTAAGGNKEDMLVIMAGMEEELAPYIAENQAIAPHFTKVFHFDDYDMEEMLSLFEMHCQQANFKLSSASRSAIQQVLSAQSLADHDKSGSAGAVKTLFDAVVKNHAHRMVSLDHVDESILSELKPQDIMPILRSTYAEKDLS